MDLLAGLALGEHFDRIVLTGNMPPSLDSLAKKYNTTLSLRRKSKIFYPQNNLTRTHHTTHSKLAKKYNTTLSCAEMDLLQNLR